VVQITTNWEEISMGQVLHGSATTTEAVRRAIQNSQASLRQLAARYSINGILWRLRTGAPWRDVPEKYGNWNSIYRRFRRWSACGVWESVAVALAEAIAESGHYNIDSTTGLR
jgi:transposase